jgi:hypothetical protein
MKIKPGGATWAGQGNLSAADQVAIFHTHIWL